MAQNDSELKQMPQFSKNQIKFKKLLFAREG